MDLLFSEEEIMELHDYNVKQEGLEEGKVIGRDEGREQTLIDSIKSLMKNMGFSIEQSMDALSIPFEDRAKLQAQL